MEDPDLSPTPPAPGLRRYAPLRRRIAAGGGYNEWFVLRAHATLGDIAHVQALEGSEMERGMALAMTLLERWSITDLRPRDPARDPLAEGEPMTDAEIDAVYERVPIPVSVEAFRALPIEMVLPVIEAAGAAANFQRAP